MLQLNRFSLTWDWSQFYRLMDAYLKEVCPEEEYRREIADLNDNALTIGLIQQSYRRENPYFLMRIMQDGACIGLITYTLWEQERRGHIGNLYILPEKRRQGLGREAFTLAEKHLRGLNAETLTLEPVESAAGFWRICGFTPDGGLYRRTIPQYQGGTPMLLYYTRKPQADSIYAPKLADSVHFALINDGKCLPLLHNSGIVYAKAVPGEQGVLHAYSLRDPWIKRADGLYHILARRIEVDGAPDAASEGKLLHFTSADLIHFTEQPLLPENAPLAEGYFARTAPDLSNLELPEGCIPAGVISLPEETALRLKHRFTAPVNIANDVPAQVEASSPAELAKVKAVARYSDGSTVEKRVDWDMSAVDFSVAGEYEVTGRIHQDRYEFPMAWHKADPAMCRWNGKYYFISTNDLDGNHSLYIREADSIPGLATAQQVCILDTSMYPHLGNLLWAPEMHIINGRLYIFHAGTPGPFVQEQSHVMALREGGSPLKASDWETPRRVVKADGSMLYDKGITLDMTVFWSAGKCCAAWSQRQFDPVDLGAWLYIAQIDPDRPWQLLSEPQVLTTPEYGWENNHTFVVEGPFALYRGGKIYLSYSGALVDSTYAVGMLSMDDGADPLDPAAWTKENYPLLTSRSVQDEYGPGHNAYVTDEDGLVWNTYHARPGWQQTSQGSSSTPVEGSNIVFGARSSGVRRVHFNAEDYPVLDMTEEMDLDPKLQWVKMKVIVR